MKLNRYWMWALVPGSLCVAVLATVALPNYSAARKMRADSRNLAKATDDYLVQRDEFEHLQSELSALREERESRGHALRSDISESQLVHAMTRPIDGSEVLDQSIRIGDREKMLAKPAGLQLDRRAIDLQMTGSFDAIYTTLNKAEGDEGMSRVRSLELRRNGSTVQASVGIDEYFRSAEVANP